MHFMCVTHFSAFSTSGLVTVVEIVLLRDMAQKTVTGDGTGKKSGTSGGKMSAEDQENFIKNLLVRCKSEMSDTNDEESWSVPTMVGYYSETSIPSGQVRTMVTGEENYSVNKLVCSPDLVINDQAAISCQICNKIYTSKAAFASHFKTHPKETEDPYRCNICSKTFAVPARLTRHYRTHTGEKPFRCEFCNKSFSVKENLSVHRRIHTKERPYKCEVCSRAFEHSGKLHRHMRIHTGERPHKCSVCSKTFIQSGQLVIHMRTHTGEKPYVCTVCQKGFTCSKQLKVHSRTHTGEKPYSCEICGKSFGYNHVLKLHQVAHYGEKVYKCTICNDTFSSKKSMEAHIKSHSENTPPQQPPTPPASSTSESSCSSSDKENYKDLSLSVPLVPEPPALSSDVRYIFYARDCLSPTYNHPSVNMNSSGVELLAAAATVTERAEDIYNRPEFLFSLMKSNQDVVTALTNPANFAPTVQYTPLNAGDGARRQVEAVLEVEGNNSEEDPILTPPSSSPVSPVPSLSPPVSPPISPVPVPDPELSLPPRKRSKMILKSMEATYESLPVRHSSVIQYARAS